VVPVGSRRYLRLTGIEIDQAIQILRAGNDAISDSTSCRKENSMKRLLFALSSIFFISIQPGFGATPGLARR